MIAVNSSSRAHVCRYLTPCHTYAKKEAARIIRLHVCTTCPYPPSLSTSKHRCMDSPPPNRIYPCRIKPAYFWYSMVHRDSLSIDDERRQNMTTLFPTARWGLLDLIRIEFSSFSSFFSFSFSSSPSPSPSFRRQCAVPDANSECPIPVGCAGPEQCRIWTVPDPSVS